MLKQPLHNEEFTPHPINRIDVLGEAENPFPGLRPFSFDESHLFFGRDDQIDEILTQIAQNRFVTVMGYSGSGKSSLMSCGLVPVLYGGFVTESGPLWNAITVRPGASPIHSMIEAIIEFLLHSNRISENQITVQKAIINSVLRSGSNGLIELARYLQINPSENIFFLIDQFEEIFRYRDSGNGEAENEAQLYVTLILNAVRQTQVPIYIALAMRSDFIGECSVFPGLTQLINNSNYLVPQMTRDQKRMVIEGPIAVAGAKISNRLIKRLLNEIGNDQDQLPILQHALMRTWDFWVANHEDEEPIDVRHYSAIGKISEALSQHANETFDELSSREKMIAEVLFKNITERNQESRGMRRPARLGLIAQLAECSEEEVIQVVEHFRKPGRSLLMPATPIPLHADSMIELSHESLMRIWNRLDAWVEDEFESATMYKRLSEAAAMYQIGKTGLWRPPDLQLALNWQKKQNPTREWGQRYDEAFERAIVFLDTSRISYEAELKNQEMLQRRILGRTRATAVVLGIAFVVAILFFVYAYLQRLQADTDRRYAEVQRNEAQIQSKEAVKQKAEAVKQKLAAVAATDLANNTNDDLKIKIFELDVAKKIAESALAKAQREEKRAIASGEEAKANAEFAELKKEEAELNYLFANRLYMRAIAQNLATKSVQEDDDQNLKGLQAMQGYIYHTRYEGKKYDPYIYRGLYSALTKLSGQSYNAMKIQGPPRVHMRSLVVSKNNNNFFTSGADGRIYKGDYEKLTNAVTNFVTPYPSKVIALSADENYLVNGNDSTFIQVYNLLNGNKPQIIEGFGGATNDIEFLPGSNNFIVASSGNTLTKVNAKTGDKNIVTTLPFELNSISLDATGTLLAGASWTGQVIVMNLKDNSYITLADDNAYRVLSISFSPTGAFLAYGLDDLTNKRGLVRMYDFETKQTRQFTGHRAGINDVEFSQDEKLLASAGLDKRLQLYVLEHPEDLPIEMENNTGFVWDIAFAKGTDFLIAACSESEIRVWPTDPSTLAEQICPKLTRNMTQDEWKKYVAEEVSYESTCVRLLIKEY